MPRKTSMPSQRRTAAITKVSILVTFAVLAAYIAIALYTRTETNRDFFVLIASVPIVALLIWAVVSFFRIPKPTVAQMPKVKDRTERKLIRRLSPRRWERAIVHAHLSVEDRSDLDRIIVQTPRITDSQVVPLGLTFKVEAVSGQSTEDIKKRIPNLTSALGVPLIFRSIGARTVECTAKLWNPLDKIFQIEDFPILDTDSMSMTYGVREDGEPAVWSFRGKGGGVIGGEPGAGKTSFATSVAGPLLISQYAEVHIIDGKGGMDWNWARPGSDFYTAEVDDLTEIAEHVEGLLERLRERVRSVPDGTDTNFWNRPRNIAQPFVLLIVDECQEYFNADGRSKATKELIQRITASIRKIVVLGRSAGFFAMLMSQKPTADAIPTAIRENCGPRLCFRVNGRPAEEAVLGSSSADKDDVAHATDIPDTRIGGAVLTEGSRRLHIRSQYLPETTAYHLIKEMAA